MAEVKGRRDYNSSRRREQAEQTRRDIINAAREELFANGYTGTSVAGVAEAAGVSPHTVYKAFGDKAALVKTVIDVAMAGDFDETPVPQRERAQRIFAEPDPAAKIDLYTRGLAETLGRSGRLHLMVKSAAEADPAVRDLWNRLQSERLAGMRRLSQHLAEAGCLGDGVIAEEARDVLWAYNSPELFELLVVKRGWDLDRYRAWVAKALIAALL
ncbi:TetR/AcrR family transcriptional regulator [Sinomonas sp. P10A9]|uniref:TetR/AcrR family transcriptional regulator n=1 Tax=Sinomonas puerhi TaxID=3238584 RepID=A0AB39L2J3_9MICC